MTNPKIETDLAEILIKLDSKLDKISNDVTDLKIGQAELKGEIKAVDEKLSGQIKAVDEKLSGQIIALDTKVDQIEKRVGNVEFASRGILIGLAVVVLGGITGFLWMASKL